MIELRFPSGDTRPGDVAPWRYPILDSALCSNREMQSLRAFAGFNGSAETTGIPDYRSSGDLRVRADGPEGISSIVVHDQLIRLACRRGSDGILLDLDDHTRIHISHFQNSLWVESRSTLAVSLLEQLVLGPGLVFLLAGRNTHFFHGSAIATPSGAILFVGPSGSGKSTLARALTTREPGWQLLADDIVAIQTGENTVVCLTRFPQPKLPQHQQPVSFETSVPIAGVFIIEPVDAHEPAKLTGATSPAGQAISLINHVMGSGTGDPVLEQSILTAVSTLVAAVPGGRLVYPHDAEGPARIHQLLLKSLFATPS